MKGFDLSLREALENLCCRDIRCRNDYWKGCGSQKQLGNWGVSCATCVTQADALWRSVFNWVELI